MVALLENVNRSARPSFLGAPSTPLGLRIVSAERAGHVVRLASGKCTIGAAPGCTLRLWGRGFQALHCVILRGPGGTAVRRWSADTRLNGGHFSTSPLRVGDRLAFGHVEFEVVELPEDTTFNFPVRFDAPAATPAVGADSSGLAAAFAAEQRQMLGELEDARAALAAQTAKVNELVAQLEMEQTTRCSLVGANELLVAAQEKLQQELETTRTNLSGETFNTEELLATLAAEQSTGESLRGDISRLTTEQQRLTAQLESARAELEAQAAKVQALTAALETELATREALVRQYEQQLAAVRQQAADQTGASEAAQTNEQSARAELKAALQRAQAELDQLRERLADAERRAATPAVADQLTAAAMHQLRLDRDTANSQVATLEQRCAELTASESDLRDETERLAGALAVLKVAAAAPPAPKEDPAQLAKLKEMNDALAARETALAERIAAVEQREEQINLYVDELARQQSELDQQRTTFTAEQEKAADRSNIGPAIEETEVRATAELPAEPAAFSPSEERTGPADVNSILARYSRPEGTNENSNAEKSYNTPRHTEESQAANAAETEAPATQKSAWEPAAVSAEEDSIEAYMARLLNRVRGEAEPAAAAAPKASRATYSELTDASIETKSNETSRQETANPAAPRPQDPAQLMRRAQLPERSENLAAMRELANHSARSAIDTHSKLQWGRSVGEKAIVAGASLACGFALLTSPVFGTSVITGFGAVVSLGTGIAWTVQAIRTFKEGKAAQKIADESRTGLEPPLANETAAAGNEFAPEMSAEEALASVER